VGPWKKCRYVLENDLKIVRKNFYSYDKNHLYYKCSICENEKINEKDNFCSICGYKIDWLIDARVKVNKYFSNRIR